MLICAGMSNRLRDIPTALEHASTNEIVDLRLDMSNVAHALLSSRGWAARSVTTERFLSNRTNN
jgi:hypothetical protein